MCRLTKNAFVLLCCIRCGAAPFANLDFESARTNNISPFPGSGQDYLIGAGPIESLLPNWKLSYGANSLSDIFLNALAREPWAVSLISEDALVDHSFVFPTGFQGRFAIGFTADTVAFTLAQTGEVPSDAAFLTLTAPRQGGTRLEARLDGVLVLSDTGSAVETGDISAFAGQTAELEIRLWLDHLTTGGPYIGLDTVAFVVPEPRVSILAMAAALISSAIFLRRSKGRKL